MSNLPSSYVLTIKPKEYLKQGLSHCGVYSLKAILSAYGKDVKSHPKEYHANWIGRHLFSFAIGKGYYDKIFAFFGLKTETKSAEKLPNEKKAELLKTLLSKNTPVMIRIGNGYFGHRYNPILGRVIPHWITLWGYDDSKRLFYVYDSGLPIKYWDKTLRIGNTARAYRDILRDWNFGNKPWHFLSWNTSSRNYLYLDVAKD